MLRENPMFKKMIATGEERMSKIEELEKVFEGLSAKIAELQKKDSLPPTAH